MSSRIWTQSPAAPTFKRIHVTWVLSWAWHIKNNFLMGFFFARDREFSFFFLRHLESNFVKVESRERKFPVRQDTTKWWCSQTFCLQQKYFHWAYKCALLLWAQNNFLFNIFSTFWQDNPEKASREREKKKGERWMKNIGFQFHTKSMLVVLMKNPSVFDPKFQNIFNEFATWILWILSIFIYERIQISSRSPRRERNSMAKFHEKPITPAFHSPPKKKILINSFKQRSRRLIKF